MVESAASASVPKAKRSLRIVHAVGSRAHYAWGYAPAWRQRASIKADKETRETMPQSPMLQISTATPAENVSTATFPISLSPPGNFAPRRKCGAKTSVGLPVRGACDQRLFKYFSIVSASDTSNGSVGDSSWKPGSAKNFLISPLSTYIE